MIEEKRQTGWGERKMAAVHDKDERVQGVAELVVDEGMGRWSQPT